jgi:dihydrofolate reductase
MRKIVLQMMTTLDGRLDDPLAWVTGVGDDQYKAMDRLYAAYDTVLVGRTTYEEMAAYWPGALSDGSNEANRSMARRMHDYRKLVFTRSGSHALTEWNNVEQVVARSDDELATYLVSLKKLPGRDIHLSGGASFATSVIGLGLVDELHLLVYPVVSRGTSWFSTLADRHDFKLLATSTFDNGVVRLHYAPLASAGARQAAFSDLIT